MGNFITRQNNQQNTQVLQDQIKALNDRITELDRNADGVISKDEFQLWQREQNILLEKLRISIIQQKDQEYHEQVTLLQKELDATKKINSSLEKSLYHLTKSEPTSPSTSTTILADQSPEQLVQSDTTLDESKLFGEVSKVRIQEAVDRMIANQNINIGYLPDIVERQLYKNMFNILLGLLNDLSDGVSIKVLGHEITMEMNALNN